MAFFKLPLARWGKLLRLRSNTVERLGEMALLQLPWSRGRKSVNRIATHHVGWYHRPGSKLGMLRWHRTMMNWVHLEWMLRLRVERRLRLLLRLWLLLLGSWRICRSLLLWLIDIFLKILTGYQRVCTNQS